MKKKYFIYAFIPAFALASIGATAYASQTQGNINQMNGLVTKLSEKFNLNQNDVQTIFNEYQTQMKTERDAKMKDMQTEMEQKVKDELTQAVSNGKITQTQMDLILAKRAEMQIEKSTITRSSENFSTKTKEEIESERQTRQTEMQAKRDALKQWANTNGISDEYLHLVMAGGMGGGRAHGGPNGMKGIQQPSKTNQ